MGDRRNRGAQTRFTRQCRHEFDLGSGEINRGWNERKIFDFRIDDDVIDGRLADENIVDIAFDLRFIDAKTGRRIALRIVIDNENARATDGQRSAEIDRRS